MKKASKFQAFIDYLKSLKVSAITISFEDIQKTIGEPLCKSAYVYKVYWDWKSSPTHTFPMMIKETGFINIEPDLKNKELHLSK